MIKLIALDIDDTLLNSNKKISDYNRDIINKAHKQNIKIVLASGRPFVENTINYYKYLGAYKTNEYYIAYNGGAIYEVTTQKEIFSDTLNYEEIMEIHSSIEKKYDGLISHFVHQKNKALYDLLNEYVYLEYQNNNIELVEISFDKLNKDFWAYKYMLSGDPKVMSEVYKTIPKEIFDKYNVCISMPCFIEFQHKSVSKGNAIKLIAKLNDFSLDDIIAIGDSENDLSMIEAVGYGICMENGRESVKKKAKFITESNDLDGVGKAIEKVLKEVGDKSK